MAKYFIIAGEASGDFHAAEIVRKLKEIEPSVNISGVGGDRMMKESVNIKLHYQEIAYMGFWEVFLHLPALLKALKFCKKEIQNFQPDAVILVDFPGFNLRIASFARKHKIKVVYYISPQLWAWKEKRVYKIRRDVGLMICILPFEVKFYAKYGYQAYYCGHPLVSVISGYSPDFRFIEKYKHKNIIAVLPGSRKQEVSVILPEITKVFPLFPDYHFLVAGTTHVDYSYYQCVENVKNAEVIFDKTYDILSIAKAGVITSGTATLETALFRVPMMVCYSTSRLTYLLSKFLIKVRFISLVNLILNRHAVKELIQNQFNAQNISVELDNLLHDQSYRENILNDYKELILKLEEKDSAMNAARLIHEFINRDK